MKKLALVVLGAVAAAAGPAAAQASLQAGARFTGQLADSDPRRSGGQHFLCFRLSGARGDRIAAEMQSTAFDAVLMTVPSCAPDAEPLSTDDDSGGGLNARLVAVLGEAPVYLRATAGGLQHGHGPFSLSLERTQDHPSEVCFETDLARRDDAVRTCTRLAGDSNQSVRVQAAAGVLLMAFALDRADFAVAVLQGHRTLSLPDLPDDLAAEALERRAIGYRSLEKYAEALEDLDEAERRVGANGGLFVVRADVLSAMGDRTGAGAALDRAISLEPDNAYARGLRGEWAFDQRDWPGAIAAFNEALQRNPEAAPWYFLRGRAHEANGDVEAGIADLDRAIEISPDLINAWFLRAQWHERQNRLERALADYDRTLTLNPTAEAVLDRRRSLHLRLGNFAEAIADADRVAQLAPNNASHENGRCWARAVANRELEVARAACDRSLALKPDEAFVLDSRALVSFRQGRFQDAWNDYDRALRLVDDAGYRYGRGLAALKLGRTAEGQADILRALGADGDVAKTYADMGLRPE